MHFLLICFVEQRNATLTKYDDTGVFQYLIIYNTDLERINNVHNGHGTRRIIFVWEYLSIGYSTRKLNEIFRTLPFDICPS